jgi:hypothetical protein
MAGFSGGGVAPSDGFTSTGGAGGAGGAGTVGNTNYALVDPAQGASFGSQLGPLLARINALQPPSYQSLVTQGLNSPLLQSILGPAMANLLPGEETGRQNFMDEFRRAGALGSGAMGSGAAKMETGFQNQRGNLISQVISQMLPQITGGLSNEWNQNQGISQLLAQVLGLSKPSIVQGQNTAGGAGGGGGASSGAYPSISSTMPSTQNTAFDNRGQPINPTQPDLLGGLDLSGMGGMGGGGGSYSGVGLGPTPQSTYNNAEGNAGLGQTFQSNADYGFGGQTADLTGTGWEQYF